MESSCLLSSGCISETIRCRKLILGKLAGTFAGTGVAMQCHGVALI